MGESGRSSRASAWDSGLPPTPQTDEDSLQVANQTAEQITSAITAIESSLILPELPVPALGETLERYARRCLDAVAEQTRTAWEIHSPGLLAMAERQGLIEARENQLVALQAAVEKHGKELAEVKDAVYDLQSELGLERGHTAQLERLVASLSAQLEAAGANGPPLRFSLQS